MIDITAWLCFEILNIGIPEVESLSTGTRILDGLFQATGLRTSGLTHLVQSPCSSMSCSLFGHHVYL